MLIFNCTKAAAEFFTVTSKGVSEGPVEDPPGNIIADDQDFLRAPDGDLPYLSQWLVHAVRVNRKYCLFAMNVDTRYCITLVDLKKGDAEGFTRQFTDRLLTNMLRYGKQIQVINEDQYQPMLQEFTEKHAGFRFFKRTDKSVQTHINDVVWNFRRRVDEEGSLPDSEDETAQFDAFANQLLRRTKTSRDYFIPYEEMLLVCLEKYIGLPDEKLVLARQSLKQLMRKRIRSAENPAQEIVARMTEKPTRTAGNVVSLDAYRTRR